MIPLIRTETEAETETETETQTETDSPNGAVLVSQEVYDQVVEAWNDLAEKHGLSKVQHLNSKRKNQITARLKQCGGLEGWKTACRKISESPFLLGETSPWKANFDFAIRESNFIKLMEDGYQASKNRGNNHEGYAERVTRQLGDRHLG